MAHVPAARTERAEHPARPASAGQARRIRPRRMLAAFAPHVLLALVALLFMWPFYWMATSGFKSLDEILSPNVVWFPQVLRWSNFGDVLDYPGFPFLRYMGNSLFYAGSVTAGTVLSCSCAGYGFARLRFPGRNILFALTIATMMIPSVVTFIPTYVLFRYSHLLGTYAPLILPSFFGNAFFIFMLRQFFMGLPWELSEAAKVDGASEFRIFWRIMLPLVRPALIVVAVFSFVWTWQEFFQPLIYLSDPDSYPLSLGLFAFQGQRTTDWQLLMAAGTLTTLPLVVLFFAAQRYFLQGITMTGLKG